MSEDKMQGQRAAKSRRSNNKSTNCISLCCTNCRVSVSSSTEDQRLSDSDRYASISTLSHYMVQERLDQMIKENEEAEEERSKRLKEARKGKQKKASRNATTTTGEGNIGRKFVVMVAMEKCTSDPREDFRQSMVEVILANRIEKPKDLRYLLNCYLSMNSEEQRGVILGAFHQVCTDIFFCCKCH